MWRPSTVICSDGSSQTTKICIKCIPSFCLRAEVDLAQQSITHKIQPGVKVRSSSNFA